MDRLNVTRDCTALSLLNRSQRARKSGYCASKFSASAFCTMQALRPFKASRAAEAALIVADAAYIAILWPSLMTFCFAISLNWKISVCTRALSSKHVSVRISRTSAAALSTFASSTEQLTSSTGVAISAQRDMTRSRNVSLPISRLMAWKRDSES